MQVDPLPREEHNFSVSTSSPGVTFLFTDIEGSTRLWQFNEAAMRAAVACHDELLQSVITQQGGRVFSTMGDGMAAVFPSAGDAVAATIEVQRRMRPGARGGVSASGPITLSTPSSVARHSRPSTRHSRRPRSTGRPMQQPHSAHNPWLALPAAASMVSPNLASRN